MKKIAIFLIVILGLTFPLCSIVQAKYGNYDMPGEFTKWLENNPLDRDHWRDMKNPANYSTLSMEFLEAKYIKLWDKELNVIYQKLLLKLNDEEKELLVESQVGWLQYHEKEQDFVNKALKKDAGSFFRVQKLIAYRLRIRDRTLELMEYYHRLGGNAEFEYKENADEK